MEILRLENGIVILDEEAEALPCIKSIKTWDRSERLLNYQNILTGIYFIYKPDGIYENLNYGEKKEVIFDKGHITKAWNNYEKNKHVIELIDVYSKTVLTPARKFLEKIKTDMDNFLEHLSDIPLYKKEYLDQDVEIDVDGEKRTVRVQKSTKVSNMKEKEDAYKSAFSISQMFEKQNKIVMQEVLQEKAKKAQRRKFDKKGSETPFNI